MPQLVRVGDYAKGTIYSISRETGYKVSDIIAANPGINVNSIPSGASIKLPTSSAVMQNVNIDDYGTIYQIHKHTGVPVEDIIKANPDIDINHIPPHTNIKVPSKSIPSKQTPKVTNPKPPTPIQEAYEKKVESKSDREIGNEPKKNCKCNSVQIHKKFLTPNKYSRPTTPIQRVKAIVIHWVANPNSTAMGNRNFFESRKYGKKGYGSAHYIVGLSGEIIQCIPESEQAYHVGARHYTSFAKKHLSSHPNNCTIGIELTHVDWEGRFKESTLNKAKCLTAKLLKKYNLSSKNIIRHYDVTRKICPKYFVDHTDAFERFKNDVELLLKKL